MQEKLVNYCNLSIFSDPVIKFIFDKNTIMKLIIRGKKREFISAIGKSLNILLPTESNTSTQSDK